LKTILETIPDSIPIRKFTQRLKAGCVSLSRPTSSLNFEPGNALKNKGRSMPQRVIQRFIFYAQEVWILLRDTYYNWSNDKASTLGAALAFYTIFSLAPIFIIIVAVVGFILGKASVNSYILVELAKFIGENNASYVMNTINNSYQASSGIRATIVAILLILVGATTVCVMLKNALNTMWDVEPSTSSIWYMLIDRIRSLLIVVFGGAFLFLSMVIGSLISAAGLYINTYINIPFYLLSWLNYIFSLLLLVLLFALLFKVLPDAEISWRDVWIGGAITALLFTLGRFLLGLYMARSTISSAYGAAGSLVVILLWVYYCAQIIFLGAEFTQVYAKRYGSDIVPKTRKNQEEAV
jgi:membrane protein